MVKVMRGNKQLTISEQALPQFLGMGYSQIDEDGNIIKQGEATTLVDIKAENKTLKNQIENLNDKLKECFSKEEIEKLNDDMAALKAENETLKKENKKLETENKKLKSNE